MILVILLLVEVVLMLQVQAMLTRLMVFMLLGQVN